MKRPWLLPALAGVELMLAVMLAALCALHIYYTVVNNRLARRLFEHNVNQKAFNTLVARSLHYGTRSNSAVLRALEEAGLRVDISSNSPPASGSLPLP